MATKFENFDKNINKLVNELEKFDLITPVMKDAESVLKRRIFNEGKATNGSKLGSYKTEAWKRKRQKAKRQTSYKDLEFSGDLRRDIVFGDVKKSKGVSTGQIGFAGGKSIKETKKGKTHITDYITIAKGQEEQTGKEIFAISEKEEKGIMERAEKLLFTRIENSLDKIFK